MFKIAMKRKCSLFRDIYEQPYNDSTRLKLYCSSKGSCSLMQRMCLMKKLTVHSGCVNTISWNRTGEYILSGSDDQHIVLTNAYNYKVLTDHKTSHRANIFSAKFLPNTGDQHVISCSGDGIILFTDLTKKEETFYNQFNCHSGTTYEVMTIPGDSHSFLSCGEDGTVRWFDLRVKDRCNKPHCKEDVMISCKRAVTALSVNPAAPYQLAIGCSDSTVRMFDRRMLGTRATGSSVCEVATSFGPFCSFSVPEFEGHSYRITSLSFSPDGEEVLVSYSSDYLYLFSMKEKEKVIKMKSSPARGAKSPSAWERARKACGFHQSQSQQQPNPPVKRLRLRGDWSDTGPDARPEREGGRRGEAVNLNASANEVSSEGTAAMDVPQESSSASIPEPSILQSVPRLSTLSLGSPTTDRSQPETGQALDLSSSNQNFPSHPDPEAQHQSPPFGSEIMTQDISNLQDHLSSLREGFIERHHSEPAISLVYSEHGSASGSISLGVGDEVGRQLSPSQNITNDGDPESSVEDGHNAENSADPVVAGSSGSANVPARDGN
ncbi:hypothetical protein J437_LFUL002912 [Ladona fulva]|uniref:Uncharacterized protein n=1 Tax=Ladona fulva TaxID=123851 RepID=A0A8K0KRJ0_LADFU|nr:hypothetical protein J437_LFUL002912 [Ladona fulva]